MNRVACDVQISYEKWYLLLSDLCFPFTFQIVRQSPLDIIQLQNREAKKVSQNRTKIISLYYYF